MRKEMAQTPHGTSQSNHGGIAFRKLVEACHEAAIFFQLTKHALEDLAPSVLGPIKQSGQAKLGFALHRTQRDDGLHSIVVAVAA